MSTDVDARAAAATALALPQGRFLDLTGRRALVTGAGQGVGRGVALTLAAYGADVIVNDFVAERAEAVAAEIVAAGGKASARVADITRYDAVAAMMASAGALDILVNNAGNAGAAMGLADWTAFESTSPAEWDHWLGANLFGVLNCTRHVLAGMRERRFGRILTITSDAGRVGDARFPVYAAAKAAAAGFTRSIAKLAGRDLVTANCIALGGIATPGAAEVFADEALVRRMLSQYVIRRVGQPSDCAYLVLFLASDAGAWITGQTYPVNGGFSFAQ